MEIIAGAVCVDHVHLSVAIPPKLSVSSFMGYLKGKSTLMVYDRHPELQSKWDKAFWARGYYVETIGNITDEAVQKYINQGLTSAPDRMKETWTEGQYKYVVRIHEGNPKYTTANTIYKVSRQSLIVDSNGQGTGLEYLGTDGNWYHKSVLTEYFKGGIPNPEFNEYAAQVTHISINGGY